MKLVLPVVLAVLSIGIPVSAQVFPLESCGDPSDQSRSTWHPVFVTHLTLQQAQEQFCRDAFATQQGEREVIQLGSFSARQRAAIFASLVNGEVGAPYEWGVESDASSTDSWSICYENSHNDNFSCGVISGEAITLWEDPLTDRSEQAIEIELRPGYQSDQTEESSVLIPESVVRCWINRPAQDWRICDLEDRTSSFQGTMTCASSLDLYQEKITRNIVYASLRHYPASPQGEGSFVFYIEKDDNSSSILILDQEMKVLSADSSSVDNGFRIGPWNLIAYQGEPLSVNDDGSFNLMMMVSTRSVCEFQGKLERLTP